MSAYDATRYNASAIETKWQAAWEKAGTFKASRSGDKPKYYVLEMFPYPSGRIHMGHVRNYTMGDVVARHKMATGHNVLHPMGWDAFGMPAENAAMASGIHPQTSTHQQIAAMKEQMKPWAGRWTGRVNLPRVIRNITVSSRRCSLILWIRVWCIAKTLWSIGIRWI